MIFMRWDTFTLGLWFSHSMCQKWQQPFLGGFLFFSFLSLWFTFFYLLFFLSSLSHCTLYSFSESHQSFIKWPPYIGKERKKRANYGYYFLAFCWKKTWGRLQALMMMTMMLSIWFLFFPLQSLSLSLFYFFSLGSPSSTHDDPGCQGLANKKSTSTIQLLVHLWWMTPVRELNVNENIRVRVLSDE